MNIQDLLHPTLQGERPLRELSSKAPFATSSVVFVSFFGGPIAGTVCLAESAKRMGAAALRKRIIAIGVAAVLLQIGGEVLARPYLVDVEFLDPERLHRRATNAAGLLAWTAQAWLMKGPTRRYHTRRMSEEDALWRYGLIAVLLVGTVERLLSFLIISGMVTMMSGG